MGPRPPTLAELQESFQAALLKGKESILSQLLPGVRTDRETMFGVYRHAYTARLAGILRDDYPRLHAYLGDDRFSELARAYIAEVPSRHRSARWVGHHLPEFLARTDLARDAGETVELARLERALADAFDAPDDPQLTRAALSAIPPQDWPEVVFCAHPSAQRLDMAWNTFAIWSSLKEEAAPPARHREDSTIPVLVWRRDVTPYVRQLAAEEAMLWDEATRGVKFARLCELAAVFDDPATAAVRVAGTLASWLDTGTLTRISVSKASADVTAPVA